MSDDQWLEEAENSEGYSLDSLKELFEVREVDGGWLVLSKKTDEFDWQKFAAFDFHSSSMDKTNVTVNLVFHGCGFPSNRECRHTWWGKDGYLFYPNGKLIAASFKVLSEFFDEMA